MQVEKQKYLRIYLKVLCLKSYVQYLHKVNGGKNIEIFVNGFDSRRGVYSLLV